MPALSENHQFPPVLGVSELAQLIKKNPSSIIADRYRAPHRVPPSCEPPGSQQPLWLLDDVLNWLRSHQRQRLAPTKAAVLGKTKPTKAEQIEAERLGITVRGLRQRQAGQQEGGEQ